ncbi:hypothetical protein ACFSVM_09780 [Paenibacillus shunpengii]|uniref:DUF3139 domain-containing protein n=1 Tax=Paenibacillus shunpengii TaxID=2054424 RepID=A0ABW5SLT0_9BACL
MLRNRKNHNKLFYSTGILLIVIIIFIYLSIKTGVGSAVVKLDRINEKSIHVTYMDNITHKGIGVPQIVTPFLEEGKEYYIRFNKNFFGQPKALTIEEAYPE